MRRFLLVLIGIFGIAGASLGQQQLDVEWGEGLKFKGRDGAYEMEVGGRLLYDVVFLKHDKALDVPFGTAGDKVEVRRRRKNLAGTT